MIASSHTLGRALTKPAAVLDVQGEGHVRGDCPHNGKKAAKVKGKAGSEAPAKVAAAKKGSEPQQHKIEEVSTSASASASSKEVDWGLLSEASGLLKSLGGLKVVRVR